MRVHGLWWAVLIGLVGCGEELVCPTGQAACGDACVQVDADPANCGTCGNACGDGEACRAGACTDCASACGAGQTCEGGVCRADVYVACFSSDDVRGVTSALEPAGPARAVDDGPLSLAWSGGRLFASHSLVPTVVGFEPNVAGEARFTLGGGDLQNVRASGGLLLVTDALASTLVAIDPARGVVDEIALARAAGVGENPTGVAIAGDVAVVALYGDAAAPSFDAGQALAVVEVGASRACAAQPCGAVLRRISLDIPRTAGAPGAYDPPGFPFPSRAAAVGTKVYVTLANLEEECSAFGCFYTRPAGNGRLAVVDTTSSAPATFVDLGAECTNPGALAPDGTTLWVSCGASGTVVPVAVGGAAPAVGAAVALPIVPGAIAACGGQLFVGDQYSGKVARLGTSGGAIDTRDVCTGGEFDWAADVTCPAVGP